MRKWILLGFIICLASFLRLWQLGSIPYGFLNDEVVAIYNAQSIWQTGGHVADGSFLPLTIHGVGNDLTPVPVYIDAVFIGIFGSSPFVARLPYALAGIGSVLLLFFLLYELTHNEWIGLGGTFSFAVSPWHIIISRGAWESIIAIFLYLLGILIFIKTVRKGSFLWSLPAFLLAFYSYNADKIFFVIFIVLTLFWYRHDLFKRKKEATLFILGIVFFIVSFIWVLHTSPFSRSSVLLWQNTKFAKQITDAVATQRSSSTAPHSIQILFTNKNLEIVKSITDTYLNFFSPYYLFLHGDTDMVNGYGNFFWGQMYLIELVFFLAGIGFLLKKNNRQIGGILLIGLFAAPFATALTFENTTNNYFFRSNIAIPFLCAIVGFGMYFCWQSIHKKRPWIEISLLVISIIFYGFFISKFLYTYYFQFTTVGSNFWLSSTRSIIATISENVTHGKHVYIAETDREFLMQYAFFTHTSPQVMQSVWGKENAILGAVTFGDACSLLRNNTVPTDSVVIVPATCNAQVGFQQIVNDPYDTHPIWKIYEK